MDIDQVLRQCSDSELLTELKNRSNRMFIRYLIRDLKKEDLIEVLTQNTCSIIEADKVREVLKDVVWRY